MLDFIKITIITIAVSLTTIVGGFFVYDKVFSKENENSIVNTILKEDPKEEKNINALIVGIDELGIHTDTIILANFDTKGNYIDLVSIPRDLRVQTTDDMALNMPNAPRNMKITEVYAYAGQEKGMEYLQEMIEDIFHTEVEFWLKIELEAFRYLVDEMGGVYFDVPMNMVYSDPYQNLYINIEKGYQKLNGEQAEQVIRFRSGYANADLGRIAVQQDFMKAVMSQLLESEDRFNAILSLGKTGLKYTENNITIEDISDNLKYVDNLSPDKIRTFTLPVETTMISGRSYVVLKEEEFYNMKEDFFYIGDKTEELVENVPSSTLKVKVLNGSGKDNRASETEKMLGENGIAVSSIGTYDKTFSENTRIFVKKEGYGEDLLEFFSNPEIIVDSTQEEDIIVVIGKED